MITLLFLSILAQQEVTVSRAQKAPYQDAVRECTRAIELTQEAPAEAAEILTRIIENRKIKKIECRLRIELRVGFFSKPYDFFPYQFRGLAFMKLASKTKNQRDREAFHQKAKKNFEESLRRGNRSSQFHLNETQKQLTLLQKKDPPVEPPSIDPEIVFQKRWKTNIPYWLFLLLFCL